MPFLALWLLSCASPEPQAKAPIEEPIEAPCTPVKAVFFDIGETLAVEQADGLFKDIYGAASLIDALETMEIPLGVISNVPRGWTIEDVRALLLDPSILDHFDVILLSSEAQSPPKPDPAIFAEGVALLPAPPPIAQTLFITDEIGDIADSEEAPLEGARAAGMVGIHLSDKIPSPLADHTVSSTTLSTLASEAWIECLEAE